MKNLIKLTALILFVGFYGCSVVDQNNLEALTQQEIDDLTFLREEEKLARDIYRFSYELYGERAFSNIANSEQVHMDKVLELLVKYNIDDPASETEGVFNNQELQQLYNELKAKSTLSLIDALWVGATIEDLDINDISINETRTTKEDILLVYESLKCASRNHIRGYTFKLSEFEITYTPAFISAEEYEEIIQGSHESCSR